MSDAFNQNDRTHQDKKKKMSNIRILGVARFRQDRTFPFFDDSLCHQMKK